MTTVDVVDLTRALVRAESPTGREGPAARVLAAALGELGYDHVALDRAGNVVASIDRGPGPTVMFNGHVDTVPAGDAARWPHSPFSGALVDGQVHGRGACDMKGALAAMAIGARHAADDGVAGRIVYTAVVQEEVGGLGARFLATQQRADLVVLGEPSDLRLMLGHRGRCEVRVRFPGRLAHAAKAELGANALARAAAYVVALAGFEAPSAARLGRASATPTSLVTYPRDGTNVVPGEAELAIDCRTVPGQTIDVLLDALRRYDPGATFEVPDELVKSEDGALELRVPRENPPYLLDEDHPVVAVARAALSSALGQPVEVDTWWFATDAPHLAAMGAPVVGFGPGNPELAHTSGEYVEVTQLHVAVDGYRALARAYLGGHP